MINNSKADQKALQGTNAAVRRQQTLSNTETLQKHTARDGNATALGGGGGIMGSLSMIMEDFSKHFSGELFFDHQEEAKESNQRSNLADFGTNEGIEVNSTGVISKGYLRPSDVASISTLGNVSRPVGGSRDNAHGRKGRQPLAPNLPHPLLEFPPLYWLLKPYPSALEGVKSLYKFRWHCSYPLQRRVVFSQFLRKYNIHLTVGELILVLPVLLTVVGGIVTTFIYPSVELSGHSARLALIFALITAMRNSFLTLLIGLPFERALWYHKLSGRLAFVNGILHTYGALADKLPTAFFQFLVLDQMNASGTGLMLLVAGVTVTSLPPVRRWCFEVFYYIHVGFVAMMTACAFYHSGILMPILSFLWIGDLICRKVVMACCRYPRKARLRVISDTVVELKLPKCEGFDYNAGQHISVAVPQIDLTFHPFSIATAPRMKYVSVLIRKAGSWTSALHALAKEQPEVSVLVEGPNGSPNVDILSDTNRYQSILLVSGGIGVTPVQSLCNQLIYEHSKGLRNLKKIRVVWTDRDPVLVNDVDVVRRNIRPIHPSSAADVENHDLRSLASGSIYWDVDSYATSMASALLTHFPPSVQSDAQLEKEYSSNQQPPTRSRLDRVKVSATAKPCPPVSAPSVGAGDDSTFRAAFQSPSVLEILELQVYLSSRTNSEDDLPPELANLPFLRTGRPDIPKIVADMRNEAIAMGLKRVAVFLCAPARLAMICQNACVKFSDHELQFDFHMEYQE
ncbi:Ferric reduction oxidase [Seminavis robusta]|uniref:Ferric reduction oxidase n=1 Tax=Seminavis robusta TaxID=568900 RepID=A0A9N8HUM9_9STRA|nr:Ferric reduction oxidase [Seminavis robusta]|eukprot:Sro1845_g301240.1 Ferric reduction oxidase (740) ;mRNA; f:1942-4308